MVGDLPAEAALDVPVDAVVGHVQLAADEPLGERQLPFEGRLERLGPADPLAGQARPEALEVLLGLVVDRRVGQVGLCCELLRRRERLLVAEQYLEILAFLGRVGRRSAIRASISGRWSTLNEAPARAWEGYWRPILPGGMRA